MKTKIIIGLIVVAVAGFIIWGFTKDNPEAKALDSFAQCLADKNVVMYGASSCKYCQQERAAFGKSFDKVNYVECPTNTKTCIDKGIEAYPTWIFGDGSREVGLQGLDRLAQKSGCELPKEDQPAP